ncbi:MAG TPA: GHMP kinase [Actinomycetota bacterium]|jgi:D-glycero-alpha-D-manno-heptose-7-phosphate kinase|nr:GHMP kinase [Actinomycetota bacterium]
MSDREIRAAAPLRISFVGGGTDFPHWYERHGGAVLSATIDRFARVSLSPRSDARVRLRDLRLDQHAQYHLREGPTFDGVLDLPKAAVRRLGLDRGIDLELRSDAPPGSGLGGSSAMVTAVVAALAAFGDIEISAHELAHLSYTIERNDLGIAGGWQDQYAAAFGGFNLIEFAASGVAVTSVRLSGGTIDALRRHLLLCYTGGVRTNLGLIDTQIRLYREGREETIQGMKQLQAMAYEMRDVLEAGDVGSLGPLLQEAYESKRRMNPHIADGTAIDELLARARAAGATGGKICGAGGGGYLLLSCPPEVRSRVRRQLEALGARFSPFDFSEGGVEARTGSDRWTPRR